MNVFISFAKEDKNTVNRLEEIVRHGGGRSWQFVYDLHGARDWRSEIQYKIDQCEVFLFVITENSLESEWCLKELQHAALIQKPIVSVVFTTNIDIPHPLNSIQYVLFDESPESGAKLVRALTDPRPLDRDKIPADWHMLGASPMNAFATGLSRSRDIPIPRLRSEPTDLEKNDFLSKAIVEMRGYFADALQRFESAETRVTTRLKDNSNSDFRCEVYVDGNLFKSCRVRVNNDIGLPGIAYSAGRGNMARYDSGGINALIRVSASDGNLALEFVMNFITSSGSKLCTVEEASLRLWDAFTSDFAQDNVRW